MIDKMENRSELIEKLAYKWREKNYDYYLKKRREYESRHRDMLFDLFLGWGLLLIAATTFIINPLLLWQQIFIIFFGILALYVGYSKRKELKELE